MQDLRFVYDGWNVVMVLTPNSDPQETDLEIVRMYTWGLALSNSR